MIKLGTGLLIYGVASIILFLVVAFFGPLKELNIILWTAIGYLLIVGLAWYFLVWRGC